MSVSPEQFKITEEDVAFILSNRIVERFYIMHSIQLQFGNYQHFISNTHNLLYVLKAFFVPQTMIVHRDKRLYDGRTLLDQITYSDFQKEFTYPVGTFISRMKKEIRKLSNVKLQKFHETMVSVGYGRRFDVLRESDRERGFAINPEILLTLLYTIVLNNNSIEEEDKSKFIVPEIK